MRTLLPLLLLSAPLQIARAAPEPAADAAPGEALAVEPEGSLWDYIEASTGAMPTEAEIEASRELAEERFAEQALLNDVSIKPETSLYVDPIKALEEDPLHSDLIDPSEFDIPVVFNDWVAKWMRYFTDRGRVYYHKWLGRSTRWRPGMYEVLEREGMPRDLVYLSMIESGYSTSARSYAAAVGLWQFIASTARMYDLRVDYWADERRDPAMSTNAAVAYLKDLHETMDDWYLAWASYNAGPGRVNGAIRKHGTRDFWVIAEQTTLHPETRNYVPKILAAAIIGKHPERYGFTDVEYQPRWDVDTVEVEGSVSFDVLAKCAGISEEDLRALNPALLRESTPPSATTLVNVPADQGEVFASKLALIPPEERLTYRRYRVQQGDSLGKIARAYGISTTELAQFNRITDPNRIYVGMELVVPVAGQSEPPPATATASSTSTSTQSASKTWYTVARGDTLSGIAARYGVTTSQLKSWNDLSSSNHIQVGQRLEIHGGTPSETARSTHTVARGDTLSGIASRYGVSVSDLQRWNGINDASSIYAGQTLKLYTPAQSWTSYTVRSGDSLGRIAQRHDCSVDEIQSWNGLTSTVIQPGQVLKIKSR